MAFKFELITRKGHILVDLDSSTVITPEEIELLSKLSTTILMDKTPIQKPISMVSGGKVEIRPNPQNSTTFSGSREEYYSPPGQVRNLTSPPSQEEVNNAIEINALEVAELIKSNKNVQLKFVGVSHEEKFKTIRLLKAKTSWGMRMCRDIIENEMQCPAMPVRTAVGLVEEFKQLDGVYVKIIPVKNEENEEDSNQMSIDEIDEYNRAVSVELGIRQDA